MLMENKTKVLLRKLKKMPDFNNVEFVIFYGSQVNGDANKMSDYDFVIFYRGNKQERFEFRVRLLGEVSDNFDVKTFQDLPVYIQKEALKGKVVYSKDLSFVYSVAYETLKKFEDFKRGYYDYIGLELIK